MELKKKSNIFNTVTFRLTVWYTVFFILSSAVIFISSKSILSSNLTNIIDRNLFLEVEEFDKDLQEEGLSDIKESIYSDAEAQGLGRTFYRLLSSNLKEIASTDLTKWKYISQNDLRKWAKASMTHDVVYHTTISPDDKLKARIISKIIGGGDFILQVGKILFEDEALLDRYNKLFFIVIMTMLIFGVTLGWLAINKTMSGVQRVTETALRIGKDGFGHRVLPGNEGEEIDRLAEAFNNMLDRIEKLMQELQDISNNVAHDLRTPITRIRGYAETTLQGKETLVNYKEYYGTIVEECDHLSHLINTILEISETDTGIRKHCKEKIDIVSLVKKGFELFVPVAADKKIQLEFKGTSESIYILGDAPRVQRLVANLLDNAIKFTKINGNVLIELKKIKGRIEVSVKDSGIGISSKDLSHIFEKFYRVESSRSIPGNGLGLSWVKSILTSLGWSITVSSLPGKGSIFTIEIPCKENT